MTTAPDVERLVNLRAAKDLMDRSYSEELDLDAIAGEAGYSRFHFVRSFRDTYGRTPRAYLSERRIERARELLRTANLTVTRSEERRVGKASRCTRWPRDWSSDVCSSDLPRGEGPHGPLVFRRAGSRRDRGRGRVFAFPFRALFSRHLWPNAARIPFGAAHRAGAGAAPHRESDRHQIGRASCRESE